MPAAPSSSLSSGPRVAAAVPYAKPIPRPRRTRPLDTDPALDTLGAMYIGWGAGQHDPAPLCGQARARLVKAFGQASFGWMSVQPLATVPPSVPTPTTRSCPEGLAGVLPNLRLGALPPLPPLPRTGSDSSAHSSIPPATPDHSSSVSPTPSTPVTSVGSPLDFFMIQNSLAVGTAPSTNDAFALGFADPTLALPLVDSRPSSPRLSGTTSSSSPLQNLVPQSGTAFVPSFSLSLPCVPEHVVQAAVIGKNESEVDDDDAEDEALWSAGEDPLWNCAATDVMSEAGWTW